MGFVPKDSAVKDLVEAIHTVRTGKSYLAPGIADRLVSAITSGVEGSSVSATELTRRQREVLRLIAEGLSSKEIAGKLGISPKTAQSHRGNLMQKLGVHKASGLVRYAIRNGIVTA
jgi:two-component system NarL family response regulator